MIKQVKVKAALDIVQSVLALTGKLLFAVGEGMQILYMYVGGCVNFTFFNLNNKLTESAINATK